MSGGPEEDDEWEEMAEVEGWGRGVYASVESGFVFVFGGEDGGEERRGCGKLVY